MTSRPLFKPMAWSTCQDTTLAPEPETSEQEEKCESKSLSVLISQVP